MRKYFILGIVILLILSMCPATALACTVFSVADGDQVLFGNNEDWLEKDVFIWFVPSTPNEYGRACVGFENAHPQGGMNDQGLALDWVAFKNATNDNLAPVLDTKDNYAGDINDHLLATCASVDDVIAFYKQYNDVNIGYATLFAADKTGASVTITWDFKENDLKIIKPDTPINSLGYGSSIVKVKYAADPRADKDLALSMLKASFQPELTLYSNIFDLNTGDITLYYNQNCDQSERLNLTDELQKGPHIVAMASLFHAKSTVGNDVINPQTLLPLYLRVMIYVIGAFLLFGVGCRVLSVIKQQPLKKIEAAAHLTGILSGLIAAAVLCFMYFNWSFLIAYGFKILGIIPYAVVWILIALTIWQITLCIILLIRRILKRKTVYIISTVLLLFVTAEILLNGLLKL